MNTSFKSLQIGTEFLLNGVLYRKTKKSSRRFGSDVNMVQVDNGLAYFCDDNTTVIAQGEFDPESTPLSGSSCCGGSDSCCNEPIEIIDIGSNINDEDLVGEDDWYNSRLKIEDEPTEEDEDVDVDDTDISLHWDIGGEDESQ